MRARRTVSVKGPELPKWHDLEFADFQLIRDGRRAYVMETLRGQNYTKGTFHPFESTSEYVLDGTQVLDVGVSRHGKSMEELSEKPMILGINGSLILPDSSDLDMFPMELARIGVGGFAFGSLQGVGKQWLPDLIEKIDSPAVTGNSDNPLVTIKGQSHVGFVTLVIDTEAGCLPKSLDIERSSHHYLGDKKISEYPEFNYGGYWPTGKLEAYIDRYHDLKIENRSGRHCITAVTQDRSYVFQNGDVLTIRERCELDSFEFPDEFSDDWFRPKTPIPDNTPVALDEAPQLGYHMQNGNIVASFDEEAVKAFVGARPEIPRGRFRLILINSGILLFCVSGFVFFARRNARTSQGR